MSLSNSLDTCGSYAPEYAGNLSNHLPMALHALHELGAGDARLSAFAARAAQRLRPLGDSTSATLPTLAADAAIEHPDEPRPRLGDMTSWPQWLSFHQHRVRALGAAGAVAEALPQLMPGVSAAAFHGLLRTAHGLAAGHAGEVAQGLAYWAARHQMLGAVAPPVSSLSLPQWWAALTTMADDASVDGRLISSRMRAWAEKPGFSAVAGALRLDAQTLPELARQAAAAYADSGDFTLLHVVTSSWALQQLMPLTSLPALQPLQTGAEQALRHYTVAVAAGWLACAGGRPAPPLPVQAWPTLCEAALASDGEHCVKLVFAARAWYRSSGHVEFQQAATRAVAG